MDLQSIKDKIRQFTSKMNEFGVPLPMLRDPSTGKGSVSLTLVFLSSLYVQFGLINRFAGLVKGIDPSNSQEFFIICCSLYFGRSFSKKMSPQPEKKLEESK
jgi:hypothetical protein